MEKILRAQIELTETGRLFHETALTSRLCESKFGTVTQGGSGKKPGSTYMKQILHHLDVVDLIKLEDQEDRGFWLMVSKRQWKDPTTRTKDWNDGSCATDPAIRERWWRDVIQRLRNYPGANKAASDTVRAQNRKFAE